MEYWSALEVLTQVAGEIGLTRPTSIVGLSDVQSVQLLSLLNSAGNELLTYYPWEQFVREWNFTTVPDEDTYTVPTDLAYLTDQTQWDRTNHWPLLGPKSAQEWAFLKGALVAQLPRVRYRIIKGALKIFPTLTATSSPSTINIAMEYVSSSWVQELPTVEDAPLVYRDMIALDTDLLLYNPWLLVKFVKLKYYELKGFNTVGVQADFMRIFNSLTGKDTGAEILSLSRSPSSQLLSVRSIPDGSWNVNP